MSGRVIEGVQERIGRRPGEFLDVGSGRGDIEKSGIRVQRVRRMPARTSEKVGTVLAYQAARQGRRGRSRRRRWATRMSQPRGRVGPGWCGQWRPPTTGAGFRRPGGCGPPGRSPPPASAVGTRRGWRPVSSRGECRAGLGDRVALPGRVGAASAGGRRARPGGTRGPCRWRPGVSFGTVGPALGQVGPVRGRVGQARLQGGQTGPHDLGPSALSRSAGRGRIMQDRIQAQPALPPRRNLVRPRALRTGPGRAGLHKSHRRLVRTLQAPGPAGAGAEGRGWSPQLRAPDGRRHGLKRARSPACREAADDGPPPISTRLKQCLCVCPARASGLEWDDF